MPAEAPPDPAPSQDMQVGAAGGMRDHYRPMIRDWLYRAPAVPPPADKTGPYEPGPEGSDPDEPGRVAVIMRTKDRPILLRRALASVTAQTFGRWHLTIVNDGGDQAPVDSLVAEYAAELGDRVTVFHNDRSRGMEAASNQALASADASYFAVHDDDDTWEPEFLRATTGFLSAPAHAGLIGVVTGCTRIYERISDGVIVAEGRQPHSDAPDLADLSALLVVNRALPISILYRMSLLGELGGFNADLPVIGDWEFNIRALLTGDIGLIRTPLANYHLRIAQPPAAYANSWNDRRQQHTDYARLLRNAVMRRTLDAHPELLGLLQPVLHAVAVARHDCLDQINRVGNAIMEQQRKQAATLLEEMLSLQAQHEEVIVARIVAELRAGVRN